DVKVADGRDELVDGDPHALGTAHAVAPGTDRRKELVVVLLDERRLEARALGQERADRAEELEVLAAEALGVRLENGDILGCHALELGEALEERPALPAPLE